MDSLIQFLWCRRAGGRPSDEASDWACSLLERGIESEAIELLAADPQLDSREQQKLLTQALRDLGAERLSDRRVLADAYHRELVGDYYAGRIDGPKLIQEAIALYYEEEEPYSMAFWIGISADSDQQGGQGICLNYPFNIRPFDDALEEALASNGFPCPLNHD